jgi:hypothetical protein
MNCHNIYCTIVLYSISLNLCAAINMHLFIYLFNLCLQKKVWEQIFFHSSLINVFGSGIG